MGMLTSSLWIALSAGLSQEQAPAPLPEHLPSEPFWRGDGVRAATLLSAWGMRDFRAETPSGHRSLDPGTLTSVGLELGYDHGLLCASATLENAGRGDLDVWVAGLHVGIRAPVPLEEDRTLRFTVGVLRGTANVDDDGFGDFEDALGFDARVALTMEPRPGWEFGLFGAYRLLAFDYKPPVDSGDEELRSRSFVGGATLAFRF